MIADTGELPAFPEVQPFADNWSYLKAELAWLDRVLMRSLAKQRQTDREIDRVAKNAADRSTSHWWKGFIAIDPSKGGSQLPKHPPQTNHPLGRFGDRLEASREQNIRLAIPALCDRLELDRFDRDLLVLCLAPEISRRYERLYEFLNNDNHNCKQPTVDLALRLFCRSDAEWRKARNSLTPQSPLIKRKIIQLYLPSNSSSRSLLAKAMLVSEKAATYFLSEDLPIESIIPKPRKK
ncbi:MULTISPECIES: hypothetical protein [Pseudanabaena]|uniref:Winged helix domain-containing protein n=2 Tax=Pseudanabaena TaxID=1152 RepID=L8N1J2_9CYAN|nr:MULTISPECIES: hypothetical protein [Pseudanabaena]ELS33586.1 hypothetical protein Pse7429DRAFT_1595 [Pseudanabaena biceps PCC 7429]MDG3494187.1 hypothetical protein [Pseudanabaena catenata USMAC16]